MKVLLVDDHTMMREGLRAVLEKQPDVEVVGEAEDGREAIALALSLRPTVVVMDITMPGLNGSDATRRLLKELPSVKVIGLSMNTDRRYVMAMFEAGAVGYVVKSSASEELFRAIVAASAGQTFVSPAVGEYVVRGALGDAAPGAHKALSAREREVLQLLAEGKASKEIAACLEIGLPTVETHRRQISLKLGLHSIAELTKYALREGLTTLDR